MKIIEILDEGLGSMVGGAIKGAAELGSEFISGATGGEIDLKNTWNKYIKTPKGTTRSINANLPPQKQFDRVLEAIYGKGNVSGQLKKDWADAINSGKDPNVTAVGNKYRDLRREEGLEGDKLKVSHSTVIEDLLRMANSGQKFEAEPKQEKEPEENPDEKL